MDPKSGNIYRNARITAGLTQERWAEYLGISADSVRKYESGEMMPAEDVLLMMADISDDEIIPYGQALEQLNEMVRSAYAVGYAKD